MYGGHVEEAGTTSQPRYHKENVADGVRIVEGIHDGEGGIAVRSFFRGLTRSAINLHVWELPPGTSEGRHTHAEDDPGDAYEEIYFVLDGRGTLHVEDEDVLLEAGDAVLVPVDVDHGLTASTDVALRIAIVFALI